MKGRGKLVYSSGGVSFYADLDSLTITKHVSEAMIAETIYTHQIRETSRGVFELFCKRYCNIGDAQRENEEKLGIAGDDVEKAVRFMINNLVEPYKKKTPYGFNVNAKAAKEKLKESFRLAAG